MEHLPAPLRIVVLPFWFGYLWIKGKLTGRNEFEGLGE